MGSNYAPNPGPAVDTAARPVWHRTGDKYFPYAARESGVWWVLRANYGFPEHDMFTLFVDAQAAADITADPGDPRPLLAGIGALHLTSPDEAMPILAAKTAATVVGRVSMFADYGSEHGDPCLFCSSDGAD